MGSTDSNVEERILHLADLYDIFGFSKTKIIQLVKSGQFPVVKIGRDYITTYSAIEKWIEENLGEEIYY